MQYLSLNMDVNRHERINYHSRMLHYSFYSGERRRFVLDIPWHWHDEFEFGMVVSGKVFYRTSQHEYALSAGDAIFLNSGVLHSLTPGSADGEARIQSHFVTSAFLGDGAVDLRYVTPVRECKALDALPLYAADAADAAMLGRLAQAAALAREQPLFYELHLQRLFSEVWETVYLRALQETAAPQAHDVQQEERLKGLIAYMQEHYQEHFSIAEAAAHSHISERECYRVFQQGLGMPPVAFLNALRLQKAQALLRDPALSITEIALECGFGSASYFGRIFRARHRITPSQYRQLIVQNA